MNRPMTDDSRIAREQAEHGTIALHVDLGAALLGFGSAQAATPAHRRIMRHYSSPLLFGPPSSDALLALVTHLYTEEEADLVQYLPPLRARTADKLATLSRRTPADARRILARLASAKCILVAAGRRRRYAIMPIVPGTFEMALMTADLSSRNSWHRRFAELFENLWDQGYIKDYLRPRFASIRYIPVSRVSGTLTGAWPSDRLEEILAPYNDFAVGNCQCRLAMRYIGKACDRPLENCVCYGSAAQRMVRLGHMRKADRQEILAIKREAERQGCVNFIINALGKVTEGNGSCSCCGCCCHVLRGITEFNMPGMICKPHYLPRRDPARCKACGKCVSACPMGAWTHSGKNLRFDVKRCIGCGLCVASCRLGALSLVPAPGAHPPANSWASLLMKMLPGYFETAARVWARRIFNLPGF